MVQTMFGKEDGETMLWDNNGTSMESPRPSRITNGNLIHLTSNQMEDPQMSDVLQPIQDGGNYSDLMEIM
jgi:signal transduction histidine kinase